MKKTKIIYLNQRTKNNRDFPREDSDEFFLFGVGHFLGEQIILQKKEFQVEHWRADFSVTEIKERKVNGLTCKVFPSIGNNKYGYVSISLIRSLKKEIKFFNVLLHFMGMHNNFYTLLTLLYKKNPIVATHLGGSNFQFKYMDSGKIKTKYREIIEKKALRHIDHAFVQTKIQFDYLKDIIGEENISFRPIFGFDLDKFSIMSRKKARLKLGFPSDKKLILQVGRAVTIRGVDWLLRAFKDLKDEMKELILFMVDVQEVDELYNDVVNSKAEYTGEVHYHDLPLYYNAADLLVYLPNDRESLNFAGTSFVPLEALACGTPVVATTLKHFPDKNIEKVSEIPEKYEDVLPMMKKLLEDPPSRIKCRQIVKKYYNWESVINYHLQVYSELFSEYALKSNEVD